MSSRSKWVYIIGTLLALLLCAAVIMSVLIALGRIRIVDPPDSDFEIDLDRPDIDDPPEDDSGGTGGTPGGGTGEFPGGGGGTGGSGGGTGEDTEEDAGWDDVQFPSSGSGGTGEIPGGGTGGIPGGGTGGGSIDWGDNLLPGGGGIGSDYPILNTDGTIGAPDGGAGDAGSSGGGLVDAGQAIVALTVRADASARVYFRYMSFGNYSGQAWGSAPIVTMTTDGYGMTYLPSYRLSGGQWNRMEMEIIVYGKQYLQPYYALTSEGKNATVQTNDCVSVGDTSLPYELVCYDYDFLRDGLPAAELTGTIAKAEQLYRSYVYTNYLDVPNSTMQVLGEIIAQQGWSANDKDVIAEIAQYVQSVARYQTDYDRALDREEDVVAAFLTQYREGVCQHFASAATLLYRALGIPARYVIGYVGDTKAGQYVNILAQNAHAWVEVYVDGLGWVNVEVTGTSASSSWGDSEVTGLPIELSSESASRAYNGEPLRGEVRLTGGSLLPGHTLTIGRQTQLTEVGKTANLFGDVRILDANGKDVTYLYAVLKSYGTLSVYARGVKLTTGSATKSYDGTPLVCRQYTLTDLCSGHRAVVVLSGTRTEIGRSENGVASVTIYDEKGNDVTKNYSIEFEFGTLRVR